MSILGGVATALVLVTVVIIVTMRLRCSGLRHHYTPNGSHDHTWKTDSGVKIQVLAVHFQVIIVFQIYRTAQYNFL